MATLGYAGKILRVDLSSGSAAELSTPDYADRFLGGRGIAAKIYWDEVPPQAGAFDEENGLVFATGPLAGIPVLGGSRWQVCGKSPATAPEQFSYCNLGGHWGAQLKFAGYDALVVQGKSDKPVYLFIQDGVAEIRDASALWGKTSTEVRSMLKSELGSSVRVVSCCPAGENMVPFAILLADNDAAGSGGFGAVMGSKRLKAIAVRGSGKATAADRDRFMELCRYVREMKRLHESGHPSTELNQSLSNYTPGMRREACYGCIAPCDRLTYVARDGTKGKFFCGSALFYIERARRYYGERNEVPFFATRLCDAYGVDAFTVGSMIRWLSKCYKAGVLTDENTGIPLSKLGSLEFIDSLVKKISLRDGFGDTLAHGIHGAAEIVGQGTKEFATDYTLKAGDGSGYCPRMYIVSGILYAMEPRTPIQQLHEIGAALFDWVEWQKKTEGSYLSADIFRKIAARFWGSELAADFSTYEGKALAATRIQDRQYVKESLILCDHMWPIVSVRSSQDHMGDPTIESKLLSAITGKEMGEEELYRVGERIFNLQRAILVRERHRGREGDELPRAFYTIPLKVGTQNPDCLAPGRDGETISRKGAVVEPDKFERMKDEFYRLRGWDVATGLQTRSKLSELGLEDVVDDLAQRGLVL